MAQKHPLIRFATRSLHDEREIILKIQEQVNELFGELKDARQRQVELETWIEVWNQSDLGPVRALAVEHLEQLLDIQESEDDDGDDEA